SQLNQCPAPQYRGLRHPEGKPVLAREPECCLGLLVGALPLPTAPMDLSGNDQGHRHTGRVRQLAGQGQRLVAPLQGLVRIAKAPQDLGETPKTKDPLMGLSEEALGAALLGVVEGDALLQMRAGSVQFWQEEQGIAQHDMRMREAGWIVD